METKEGKDFIYDAFISYASFRGSDGDATRFDRLVAEHLQKALETYRVPRALQKSSAPLVPHRLKKVFRDRDELHATPDLRASLVQALRDSRFLIVICSPRAKASPWMDEEIATFRTMKGGEQILPLLIEGEPGEAFPAALVNPRAHAAGPEDGIRAAQAPPAQPLAADIREATERKSLRKLKREKLKLLAPMLGCKYDDLRQREQERQVKRMTAVISGMVALVAVLATLSLLLFFATVPPNFEKDRAEKNEDEALRQKKDAELNLEATNLVAKKVLGLWQLAQNERPQNDVMKQVALTKMVATLTNMADELEKNIRQRYPENLTCLITLRGLYSALAATHKQLKEPEEAQDASQKARDLIIPIAITRLKAWKKTPQGPVFPNNYERNRLQKQLNDFEHQFKSVLTLGLVVDYVDQAAEYVSLLDASKKADRELARRRLEFASHKLPEAADQTQPTREQAANLERLMTTINDLLQKLMK